MTGGPGLPFATGSPASKRRFILDWITGVNLGVSGNGVYVRQQRVAAGYFHVLGVMPLVGREFIADEDRSGGPAAVVLSHALWHKYFHDDRSVIGRGVLLRGEPFTVVGERPAGYRSDTKSDLVDSLEAVHYRRGKRQQLWDRGAHQASPTKQEAAAQLASLVPELKKAGTYGKRNSGRDACCDPDA